MPAILTTILTARETVPQPQDSNEGPTISNTVLWIVAAVLGGIVFVGTTLSIVLIHYSRRRQYRRVKEREPYLTREEFFKRRKMSETELFRQEEERRSYMIRKSLASRSTMSMSSESSVSTATTAVTADQIDKEIAEMERRESVRLKDDWKRWEARERRERSGSGGRHPAVGAPGGVPILTIPSPTKHRSEGRMSLTHPPPSPPIPPRHPGRRKSS